MSMEEEASEWLESNVDEWTTSHGTEYALQSPILTHWWSESGFNRATATFTTIDWTRERDHLTVRTAAQIEEDATEALPTTFEYHGHEHDVRYEVASYSPPEGYPHHGNIKLTAVFALNQSVGSVGLFD